MLMDLSIDRTIKLTRHDRKRWSFRGGRIDVVEEAALDFLKAHGWQGYFTGRYDYRSLIAMVMGWPKRGTRFPHAITGTHAMLFMGADGWLKKHKYTYDQIYSNIVKFNPSDLRSALEDLAETKTKAPFIATFGLTPGRASDMDIDHICSFFVAFGHQPIIDMVDRFLPKEKMLAMKRLFEFDIRHRELWHNRRIGATDPSVWNLISPKANEDGAHFAMLNQPAFHFAGGFQGNIDITENFCRYILDDDLRAEIEAECVFARKWRNILLEDRKTTTLDLQLWNESGVAYVEVKAPNDKLSATQRATIEELKAKGETASLISVVEE
jgi:hypothetical protein